MTDIDERYAVACAAWEDARGALRNDMTGAQWGRLQVLVRAHDAGLRIERLAAVRYAVQAGRIADDRPAERDDDR